MEAPATAEPAALRARHVFEEHTGELRVRLEAASHEELFAEAARVLAELALGSPELPPPETEPEVVELRSADRVALLVDWLNELIFRMETERRVFVAARFDRLGDDELCASVRGHEVAELRTLVKAATLHGLRIEDHPNGCTATVVFDV